MKARIRQALRSAGLAVGVAALGALAVGAQQPGQRVIRPNPNSPRMAVLTFCSNTKGVGADAAEALRKGIGREINYKDLWVIPKNDLDNTLKNSGFPTDDCIGADESKQLATLVRTDDYVVGTVNKTPQGFHVEAFITLTRDNSLQQPLAAVDNGNLERAMGTVAHEYVLARKQLPFEEKCYAAARDNNYSAAIAAANQGIAAFPGAVPARLCAAAVYKAQNQIDSALKFDTVALAMYPHSKNAIALGAGLFEAKADTDNAVKLLSNLVAYYPKDFTTAQQAVADIARLGRCNVADPIIEQAIQSSNSDPQLMNLGWLVFLCNKNWKQAINTGNTMVGIDTSLATLDYYTRLVGAYVADTNLAGAQQALTLAIGKYPQAAELEQTRGQIFKQMGDTVHARGAYMNAYQRNAKIPGVVVQIADTYTGMPDSVLAWLQKGVQAGTPDSALISQYALSQGNTWYKKFVASKDVKDAKVAMNFLTFSNTVSASPNATFLIGATAFQWGLSDAQAASKSKSCDQAREGQTMFATASQDLLQAMAVAPDAAKQMLGYVQQYSPVVDNQVKSFCKGR